MKKLWVWIISIFVLFAIFFVAFVIYQLMVDSPPHGGNSLRVIDGDTFELYPNGPVIRLLCVDTPEKGEEGYEEAKAFLENTLYEKDIIMKSSNYNGNNTDKYGRLLRWVYANDSSGNEIFVNKYLLEEGYGDILIIPPENCNEVSN